MAAPSTGTLLTAPQSNSAVARHSRRPRSRLSSPRRLHFVGCRHVAFGNSNRAERRRALLSAAAEDLGRLLLREFALIYGNAWFEFPLLASVGCEIRIESLAVADTFGIATPIPNYSTADGKFGRWKMFAISPDALAPPVLSNATQPLPRAPVDSGSRSHSR